MFDLSRALGRLRALSPGERDLLAEAVWLLPAVQVVQKMLPFRRWRRLLTRSMPQVGSRARASEPARVAAAVERARRLVPGRYRCLPVAYTTHLMLSRHGHFSDVHVGVSRDGDGKVEAHAWVICEGRIVVGDLPDLSRFVPLPQLDPD